MSEWMLPYCLEWASIPVGKMTIPDCGPAVRSIPMNIAAEKSACLSQAKHLLSILMGINGRAGTGDRGVDWLAGPVLTQPPLSILPALLFTANTSCSSLHQLMCISVPVCLYCLCAHVISINNIINVCCVCICMYIVCVVNQIQ